MAFLAGTATVACACGEDTTVSGDFSALGIFGQSVTLFPADRLVIVVNSAWPRATDRDLFAGRSAFLYAVRDAAKSF